MEAPVSKRLVLCIDGGGVRGIIPALILRELEEILKSKGKTKPLGKYFHLISGTSTGGIIALGLCSPKGKGGTTPACTAASLVELYRTKMRDIFGAKKAQFWMSFIAQGYDNSALKQILLEEVGDATTSSALYNFLVTAYEIELRKPKIFSNI